jgi:mono/diheme cytochrome c family protein
MSTPMSRSIGVLFGVSLFCVTGFGCQHRAADLAEWTPADHHHQTEVAGPGKQRSRKNVNANVIRQNTNAVYTQPSQNPNLLVQVTWVKQCASCHGKRGAADGPNAPMFKPRDLTQPEWQDSVKDEDIVKVIKDGRNKMPAFNFPDSMLTDMVAHIRSLRKHETPSRAVAAAGGEAENEAEGQAKPAAGASEPPPRHAGAVQNKAGASVEKPASPAPKTAH